MAHLGLMRQTLEEVLHAGARYIDEETLRRVKEVEKQKDKLYEEMMDVEEEFPGYAEEVSAQLDEIQMLFDSVESMMCEAGWQVQE